MRGSRLLTEGQKTARRSGRLSGSANSLVQIKKTRKGEIRIMGASESSSKSPRKKKEDDVVIPKNATSVEDFGYYWKNGTANFRDKSLSFRSKVDKSCLLVFLLIIVLSVKPKKPEHEYYLQILQKGTGSRITKRDFAPSHSARIGTDKPFEFKGQKHYDALGDVVTEYIYDLMTKEFDLEQFQVPRQEDVPEDYKGTFAKCFMTQDALKADKLMLIVQGSGGVRAGQWARSLCINQTLHHGTILPYMHRAKERGYAMLVRDGEFGFV